MPKQIVALDFFDQQQVDIIERAIDRAWEVVSHTDIVEPQDECRKVLALCVMHEARTGEENQVSLVNRSIVAFRRQRAQDMSEKRRAMA
jgi:hypothetical protein